MTAGTITIQKGDNATIEFTLSDPVGSPYDATGSTLTFTIKKNATSAPVITKNVSSFTNGGSQATISLSTSDTDLAVRAWRYELALVDASGNRKTSALNVFYITENESDASSVSVVIGNDDIDVQVTVTPVAAIEGLPHGGTTGQVLAKLSDADLDTDWVNERFSQPFTAQTSVTVTHNLGKYPAVTVVDSAGDQCEGTVNYVSANQLIVSFAAAFSGVVYCN